MGHVDSPSLKEASEGTAVAKTGGFFSAPKASTDRLGAGGYGGYGTKKSSGGYGEGAKKKVDCAVAKKAEPVCDLPHSAASYDKTPKGDTNFSCNSNCGGKWGKYWVAKACKTQTAVGNKRSWNTCDSCKEGYALEIKFSQSRAGYCVPYRKDVRVSCAPLDVDDLTVLQITGTSEPPGDKIICTK